MQTPHYSQPQTDVGSVKVESDPLKGTWLKVEAHLSKRNLAPKVYEAFGRARGTVV